MMDDRYMRLSPTGAMIRTGPTITSVERMGNGEIIVDHKEKRFTITPLYPMWRYQWNYNWDKVGDILRGNST